VFDGACRREFTGGPTRRPKRALTGSPDFPAKGLHAPAHHRILVVLIIEQPYQLPDNVTGCRSQRRRAGSQPASKRVKGDGAIRFSDGN